jgi:hypothetical protein
MNEVMNIQKEKTNNLMPMLLMRLLAVIAVCWMVLMTASAQQKIDQLMDEIEGKGIDVNTVVKRDKKTGRTTYLTKQMTFRSRKGNYARKLLRVFDEESRKAVLVNRSNGKYRLEFEDADGNTIYYMLTSGKENPTVNLSKSFRSHDYRDSDHFRVVGNSETIKKFNEKMQKERERYMKEFDERMQKERERIASESSRYRQQAEEARKQMEAARKQAEEQITNARKQAEEARKQVAKAHADIEALQKDIKEHPERYNVEKKGKSTIITPKKNM